MTIFYAQPYDISVEGFYFRSADEYNKQASILKNQHGDPVEELELQFIDGDLIDCELAKAWGVSQANQCAFFEVIDEWNDLQKTRYIIAVGECGFSHQQVAEDPENIGLDIYELDSLKDLAIQFVDEGLFGDIPEQLQFYINYDAIARDLSVDYCETTIAGTSLIYRAG